MAVIKAPKKLASLQGNKMPIYSATDDIAMDILLNSHALLSGTAEDQFEKPFDCQMTKEPCTKVILRAQRGFTRVTEAS